MKKFRIFALVLMLASFFFILGDENSASAAVNACKVPDEFCGLSLTGGCCSQICCQLNDTRWQCEGIQPQTCW